MRIVHANKAYRPHLGGVETVVRDLAEGAARRGHEVEVLTAAAAAGVEVLDGVTVRRARSLATARSVPLAPGLVASILRARADVLHVHEPSVLPELAVAVGRRSVRRHVGRVVVSWHSDLVRQRLLRHAVGPVLDRALDAADVVLAATPHHLATSPHLQRVAAKVRVVPFGVDPGRYGATPEVLAAAARLRGDADRLVVFLGRLVYYKGVPELLAAASALPDTRFVVVGEGPLEAEVRASDACRAGRLALLPPIDEPTKVALLHAADLFVLPSTAPSEAYGIVQLEAMACGTPVVTFDLPTGVTWLNRHGETGLVARREEPGSLARALREVLDDPALAARLAAGARRRAAELTLEAQVDQTLAAYGA